MADDQCEIEWAEADVPVSRRFDDPYYSLEDGLAETRHVFLGGNRLHDRIADGFVVAELGVGTGLNLLALAALARELGVALRYIGFEAYPMGPTDLKRALAPFDAVADLADALADAWRGQVGAGGRPGGRFRGRFGGGPMQIGPVEATIVVGDARRTVADWSDRADAWFLDGFSPAKNPQLWEPALMAEVARHTAPGGTFATYTAAGRVRRALAAAGFTVTRHPGYGRKRHMSRGVLEIS